MKIKVTASTFGNELVEVFDDWNDAKTWMKLTDLHNVPHEYKDELYPITFKVETFQKMEMTEEEFNDLQDLLDDPVIEDLPIEDVEEAVAEDVAKEVE